MCFFSTALSSRLGLGMSHFDARGKEKHKTEERGGGTRQWLQAILRNTRGTEVIEQSRWGNMVGWMELYWRKGISSLSLSDIRVPVFPLRFFLILEIPFPPGLLLLFFNHPYIFQVRKELLELLDPKVCWSIKYLLWIFSLDSFRHGYCPWVLTPSFFGFFFCLLSESRLYFLWWKHFSMK